MAADEAKAVAQFEDEALQTGDKPVFKFTFTDLTGDAEELQVVPAFEHLIGLFGQMRGQGQFEVMRFFSVTARS